MNKELRKKIVDMVCRGRDGHIPSAFSIIDILAVLYRDVLKFDAKNPQWEERDYFILSKGHGCLALYVLLEKYGFIRPDDTDTFCQKGGILGEHPDCTKIPGVEANTGSLGHGLPFSLGIALGLRKRYMQNKVVVLVGDGECNEGTIWESALVANKLQLGCLCCIVDKNDSAAQILPIDPLKSKWEAFGWEAYEINGHSEKEIQDIFKLLSFNVKGRPKAIIANTIKGKGVPMLEGHGIWHHRIPNDEEYRIIMDALK